MLSAVLGKRMSYRLGSKKLNDQLQGKESRSPLNDKLQNCKLFLKCKNAFLNPQWAWSYIYHFFRKLQTSALFFTILLYRQFKVIIESNKSSQIFSATAVREVPGKWSHFSFFKVWFEFSQSSKNGEKKRVVCSFVSSSPSCRRIPAGTRKWKTDYFYHQCPTSWEMSKVRWKKTDVSKKTFIRKLDGGRRKTHVLRIVFFLASSEKNIGLKKVTPSRISFPPFL